MDLNELKNTLATVYSESGQSQWLGERQLILLPPKDIWTGMIDRNPTVIPEVKKINSSTALAINYFQLLSEVSSIRVDYEVDVAVPLILDPGKGHPAMLDAKYTSDGVCYYIESKFLEPYYSPTHEISPSYFIEEYYESAEVASKWISAFKNVQMMIDNGTFCYFDINQMFKHLLAIYRTKPSGSVVLKNLIWKPTDAFLQGIESRRSASFLANRCVKLTEEMKTASSLLNKFVSELGWKDCEVVVKYYNDELDAVSHHDSYEVFKKKYLL